MGNFCYRLPLGDKRSCTKLVLKTTWDLLAGQARYRLWPRSSWLLRCRTRLTRHLTSIWRTRTTKGRYEEVNTGPHTFETKSYQHITSQIQPIFNTICHIYNFTSNTSVWACCVTGDVAYVVTMSGTICRDPYRCVLRSTHQSPLFYYRIWRCLCLTFFCFWLPRHPPLHQREIKRFIKSHTSRT